MLSDEIKEKLVAYANNNKYVVVMKDKKLYCWFVSKQDLFDVSVFRPLQSSIDNYVAISEHIVNNNTKLITIFKDLIKKK